MSQVNLEDSIKDNSLFSLNYHDNARYFPEKYQVRRSTQKKRYVKNHEATFIWEYRLYLWISKYNDGYYQDMGKIHPNDLVSLIHSDIIIDEVIVK